jgi:hypothetical protein
MGRSPNLNVSGRPVDAPAALCTERKNRIDAEGVHVRTKYRRDNSAVEWGSISHLTFSLLDAELH